MWALNVVMSKHLFNLSSNKNELFATMFCDSEVAKTFSCVKTKCSYLVNLDIAPYFLELLNTQLIEIEYFDSIADRENDTSIIRWPKRKSVLSRDTCGEKKRNDEHLTTLMDLGICGLYTVHNAFKL